MKKHLHSFFRGEGSKPYLVVLAVGMAVVVAAILLYYSPLLAPTRAVEVPYSQFLNALEKGTVESVRISDQDPLDDGCRRWRSSLPRAAARH